MPSVFTPALPPYHTMKDLEDVNQRAAKELVSTAEWIEKNLSQQAENILHHAGGKNFGRQSLLFEEFYGLLGKMMHGWDTNIIEGMNKLFTKSLPKDRTYATTIENMVRLYLAISVDSVNYTEVYQHLREKTGLTISEVNRTMNMELDEYKLYRRRYRAQERNKIRRMRKFYIKLKTGKQKLIADN
jgi:hypothetical protein